MTGMYTNIKTKRTGKGKKHWCYLCHSWLTIHIIMKSNYQSSVCQQKILAEILATNDKKLHKYNGKKKIENEKAYVPFV